MSLFHKYVKEMEDFYSQDEVQDEYMYVRKAQIFWSEVRKFEGLGILKITPVRKK